MKQKFAIICTGLFLVVATLWTAQAAIHLSPSSANVVRGQANTIAVTYVSEAPSPSMTVATSTTGEFLSGATVIGQINLPITVRYTAMRAVVTETVIIPAGVIERAIQQGSAQFAYRRVFAIAAGPSDTAILNLTITGESIGQFGIKQIVLSFDNGRAETTVKKYTKGLKATADIRFIGSGLLKGYWEVDGRVLAQVNRTLMAGQSITLTTPDIPTLPTDETGTHTVRFVVTSPAQGIPLPSLVYFVTSEESGEKFAALKLKSPADEAQLPHASAMFQWDDYAAALYLIQFYEKADGKPVFSAYTRKTFYRLPDITLKNTFASGKTYFWKVTGFDKQKRKLGESQMARFRFE